MKRQLMLISVFCVITQLMCTWELDNPSDTQSSSYTIKSEASLTVINDGPIYQFDTVSFSGGISSEPVQIAGLVKRYDWDIGNNGNIDTQVINPSIVRIFAKQSGPLTVSLKCTDASGYVSEDIKTIKVQPRFKLDIVLPDIAFSLDTSCAFYSQNQFTMKPVILLGHYLTYRNKKESLTLGSFVFEMLKNLTGTLDVNTLSLPYKTSFNNGVYTLSNGDITMSAAFLYGADFNGHKENDTIKYDLFDRQSYVKSIAFTVNPPYYTLEKGPLWDLTSGFSVNVNAFNPTFSLSVAFENLKFCGSRNVNSRYLLSTELTDSNKLQVPVLDDILFRYYGLAKIKPFYIKDIVTITGKDSLIIDLSGSKIVSDSFIMAFSVRDIYDTSKVGFKFQVTQNILKQLVRFGNSDEKYKVLGSYSAQSALSVNEYALVKSYFRGVYSTNRADTARFFCDYEMADQFGELFFDQPAKDYLTFISDRYSYQFTMRQGIVKEQ